MSNDLQTRFAYFGPSLRIVYDCTVNARDGEEIQDILRAEAFSAGKWRDCYEGIDCLLGMLNSDCREAIRECTYVISEDGELIRNSRAKQIPVNA